MTTLGRAPRPAAAGAVLIGGVGAIAGTATTVVHPSRAALALVAIGLTGLAVLCLTRFDLLAVGMLAGRAGLDLTHTPGASALRPSVVVTSGFAVVAIVWLASRSKLGWLRLSPIGWAAAALAVAAVVSLVFSADTAAAGEGAVRFLVIGIMFVTFEHLARVDGLQRRLVGGVLIGAVVPLVVGATQVAQGEGRIQGSLSHPNTFGFFLAIMCLVALAVLPRTRGPWLLVLAPLTAIALAQLVLTYSRSSYVAFLAGAVALVLAARRWWALPLVAVAVLATLTIPSVQDRFAELEVERNASGTAGNSLVWRLEYWGELVALAEDAPATGIGSGVITEATDSGKPAHNDLVKMYVETGALGLTAYVALVVGMVLTAHRGLRRARDPWERAVAHGGAAVVVAFCVASTGSNIIQQLVSQWYVMAFLAVVSANAWRRDERWPPAGAGGHRGGVG